MIRPSLRLWLITDALHPGAIMANVRFRVVSLLVSCMEVNAEQWSVTMKTAYACAVKDLGESLL